MNTKEKLEALVKTLMRRAQKQLACEARTSDPIGKRVMTHGAFVNFNAAEELKAIVSEMK